MPTPDTYKYYPALSDRITVDELPDFLSFIKENIQSVFNNIYYKNYCALKNTTGSSAFYSLELIPRVRIQQELFGAGVNLVLNPDYEDSTVSSFPITIFWQWKILRYVRNFKQSSFAGTPESLFNLAIDILGFSKEQVLAIAIDTLVTPEQGLSPFEQLVSDINDLYNSGIDIDESDEDAYEQLVEAVEALNQDVLGTVFALYLLTNVSSGTLQNLRGFFFPFFSADFEEYLKDLLTPKLSASLENISLAIEFPRAWLKPINPATGQVYDDENVKSMLRFSVGRVTFSTENGLEFKGESNISFSKSEIGNTGLTLMFDSMKLDLSRTKNIPEAMAAGYPDDFVGVFVESAEIGLPEKWFKSRSGATLGIFGENLLLGTGGISGTFGLRAIDTGGNPTGEPVPAGAELTYRLGDDSGFVIGFRQFDVTLKQGEFVSTNINGSLTIPGFKDTLGNDSKIDISMSFDKDGNFYITASEADGIPIRIPDVFTFVIKTLTVGRKSVNNGQKFYISASGAIDFDEQTAVGKVFAEPIEIDMTIWQDGTIELKGLDGTFKLPKPKPLKLGPANITITAIHFGADERMHNNVMRKYWYFGFDGGISINPGGIDARGDGVKLYFTVDNGANRPSHVFFRIQSLSVDLIIPSSASRDNAAVIINGYLAMKEPSAGNTDVSKGTEYVGGISLDLPKLRLSASAGMRYNPSVPSFLIDVSLNLPTAIPLGPTGVGIYGFRGLLGQKYVASKQEAGLTENNSWYEYYKAKVAPDYREGIQASKMSNQDGFSVGAGVSLATAFDGGKVFSAKVFLMISLPEVLLIQGQGAILRERIGLDSTTDPPFSAMIAISSKGVEAAFGVNLKIPESSGKIATVSGTAEMAFFFVNSGAWYLNIGRNQPEEKRVRAEIFSLFKAYFYFMVSKQGIAAGAGASWNFDKKFGPIRLSAFAYLDVAGKISFKPVQIGGSIGLGAGASIGIWKLKLGIEVHAYLAAEAPKPFIITGEFSFKLKLPWPLKKLGGPYKISLTWSFNKDRDLSEIPLIDPANNVKAINRLTGEAFPVYYSTDGSVPADINSYIIPVDSFIDVEFLKGMGVETPSVSSKFGRVGAGAVYSEKIPPQQGKSKQVEHIFYLENVEIEYMDGGNWQDYDMYEAIRPQPSDSDAEIIGYPESTSGLKYGFWQCETPERYNKLRILSKSPLSYITNFTSGPSAPPEDFGYKEGFLFCEGSYRTKTCVTFPNTGELFPEGTFKERQRVLVRITGDSDGGEVRQSVNPFGLQNALVFGGKAELYFSESQVAVDLKFLSAADSVRIKYFRRSEKNGTGFGNIPLFEFVEISEMTLTPPYPENSVSYRHTEHNNMEVDLITIESVGGTVDNDGFLIGEYADTSYLLQENGGKLLLEETGSFRGKTQLFSICMMNSADYRYNLHVKTQTEVEEENRAMRDGFVNVIDPIWRPDTVFRIKISTKDDIPSERNYQHDYYFVFRTAGPLGHFHKYKVSNVTQYRSDYLQLQAADREDQFRLATLRPYIDYSRSYPNADGRLIDAKPLFYEDPKLLLFYKQNTVMAMFNNFASYGNKGVVLSELRVLIKDPTEPLSSDPDNPTQAHAAESDWKKNPNPIVTSETRMINNLTAGTNCSGYEIMTPFAVVQEIATGGLHPDRLYTAVFNAVYKAPSDNQEDTTQVHSYVFKTSQYADFGEQVQSCVLRDENGVEVKKAIFTVEKEMDATTIGKASDLLSESLPLTDPLLSEYACAFDRLTDGILQLGVLPPAVTTDFNIIKNSGTGNVIGIIVRNPEPFNDPKIPENDLNDTIQLSIDGSPVNQYKAIFSRDRTQAFVGNSSLNIPSSDAVFTFRYKQYGIYKEGAQDRLGYVTKETETVMIEL